MLVGHRQWLPVGSDHLLSGQICPGFVVFAPFFSLVLSQKHRRVLGIPTPRFRNGFPSRNNSRHQLFFAGGMHRLDGVSLKESRHQPVFFPLCFFFLGGGPFPLPRVSPSSELASLISCPRPLGAAGAAPFVEAHGEGGRGRERKAAAKGAGGRYAISAGEKDTKQKTQKNKQTKSKKHKRKKKRGGVQATRQVGVD